MLINNTLVKDGVATSAHDFAPGEVILTCPLFLEGPGTGAKLVCLGCHKLNSVKPLTKCSRCGWPVCSQECSDSSNHTMECSLLQKSNTECQIENFTDSTNYCDFITPLRFLVKTSTTALQHQKIDFDNDFKRNANAKKDEFVLSTIRKIFNGEKSEREIKTALGIVERFGVGLANGCSGLFESVGWLAHSCIPNTYYTVTKNNELLLRASVNISQGETITFCKIDLMKCNYFRRKQLEMIGIHCCCPRCKDGSEFGTGFGGLQCPECSEIMSESNSFSSPPWRCSGCHMEKASQDCRDLLDKLELELKEKSEKADNSKESVQEFENILQRDGKWSQVPENSQLLADIKYRLIFIYQYHKDFYNLEEEYLSKKVQICSEWIELSEKLYKGRNYNRLLIQYEMMNAAVSLMLWMKQAGKPSDEVNDYINKIVQMSKEPIEILVDEEDDRSLLKAFRDLVSIATEAREQQKRRVLISTWDDEEDW